jgi:hypothetical protein
LRRRDGGSALQLLDQAAEILGQRRFELQVLASPRRVELQTVGVERHARDQRRRLPVGEIPHERVPLGGELHADLVAAPGFQGDFQ